MNNKTLTIQLLIILVNMILCSCATSGLKMGTEVDSLSYAAGYCTVCEYKEQEANIFWFIKGAVPDIEKCNFDTITNVLRMAFAGRQPISYPDANHKIHDFFDAQNAGRPVNLDSLAIVYGILFYQDKFRKEIVLFEQNPDILIKGMHDALTDNPKPLLGREQAENLLRDFYEKRLPARNLVKAKQYFAEIEAKTPGIQRSKSGVLYRIDKMGSNERINRDTDICRMNYRQTVQLGGVAGGENSCEYEIDRCFSYNRFPSPDFLEIIKLMGVGGKITIWTDTNFLNLRSATSPNLPLICEYELVSIEPYQEE